MKFCSINGCNGIHHAKGYCSKHYWRFKKGKDLYSENLRSKNCSIKGCNNIHKSRGFCVKHYKRLMKGQDLYSENIRFKTCSISGCSNKHYAKGLCGKHYQRKFINQKKYSESVNKEFELINCKVTGCLKKGNEKGYCYKHFLSGGYSPNLSKMERGYSSNKTIQEILDEFSKEIDGHLLWQATTSHGYPVISKKGKTKRFHVLLWECFNGPVPEGYILDHICRIRHCLNLSHLRLATIAQNNQNKSLDKRNRSGYRGVRWDQKMKKWHSSAEVNKKLIHSSYHINIHEAGYASWVARRKYMTHNIDDRSLFFKKAIPLNCGIIDCESKHFENGFCSFHYNNFFRIWRSLIIRRV